MSWNSYIDNVIAHGAGNIDKACIIGQNGSLWTDHTHAAGIKLSAAEALAIGTAFANNDCSPLQAGGVLCEGVKYNFLRGDDEMIAAKQKDQGSLVCCSSSTAVVVVHVKEGGQAGAATNAAAKIADYLKSLNY